MKTLGCVVAAAFLSLAACGPELLEHDTDGDGLANGSDWCPMEAGTVPIDARMCGVWDGHFGSSGLDEFATALEVAVDGTHAVIHGICPNPDAMLEISGSGTTLFWGGDATCSPFALSWCPSGVTLTWTSAALALHGGATLDATFEGVARGCGEVRPVVATFHASH